MRNEIAEKFLSRVRDAFEKKASSFQQAGHDPGHLNEPITGGHGIYDEGQTSLFESISRIRLKKRLRPSKMLWQPSRSIRLNNKQFPNKLEVTD